jgi:hypothetical protein
MKKAWADYSDDEETPVTFVRSNKMAKKQKEDKKIEDIKQNLVNRS